MSFKWIRRMIVVCGFAALAITGAQVVRAQTIVTGSVAGTVIDPSGAVIAGATITLTSTDTGAVQTRKTGGNGTFQFPLLKPGNYTIETAQQGFQTTKQTLTVRLGQTTTVTMKMPLGTGTTTVEVTSGVTPLQTQDANISTNFDTIAVQNVPNPGNDLTYVAQTAPGVEMNTSTGMGGYGNFSSFGLPGTSNLFTVNGNDYNDAYLNLNNSGASNLLLGTNDVQEVSVVENGYTGQYGRMAGAQIDYTTRSGTNAFHGDAIYYWTGRALDANEWFLKAGGQPRPFQNNNQWAANFGGPIKQNKAFFFLDTEGIRYIFGTSNPIFLPTPAFQSFVLSQPGIAGNASNTAFYNRAFSLYNATPGIANAVPVGGCTPGVTALGFSGNCLQSFVASATDGNREWMLVGRLDVNLSESDKLFGQARFDRGYQPTYASPINPVFNISSDQPIDDGQLNWTHIFGSSAVNNFIVNDLYYSFIFKSPNISAALATFPIVLQSSDSAMAPLGPGGPNGFVFPQGRNYEQWGLVDDFSLTRGSHNMKFGVNWRSNDISDFTASELTLSPGVLTSLAGFATNTVDTAAAQRFSLSPEQPLAYYSLGAYFQDQWRLKPSLTLTLSLRADRNSPGVCKSNCAALTPVPFSQLNHDSTMPYNQMVVSGLNQILPNIQSVVWEPRVGFAWSPGGKSFVVRGGAGLFSDLYPGFLLSNFTNNFPGVTSWQIPAGTINPAEPGSGANLVAACNAAFLTNYRSGGNLPTYLASAPPACTASATGFPSVPQLFSSERNIKNPMYAEWNLEVQKSIGAKGVFSINYVGNHGYDEFLINPYVNSFCGSVICAGTGFTASGLPAAPLDQRVGTTQQLLNGAFSNYNGVTFTYKEQMSHGFSMVGNYTYSHSLDIVSNGLLPFSLQNSIGTQIDPFNSRLNYANSDYDLRSQASLSYVWALPGPKNGWMERLLGGWQVSGTAFWHTGYPFSMIDGITGGAIAPDNMTFAGAPAATILLQPTTALPNTFTRACADQFARSLSPNPGLAATATPCFTASDFAPSTTFLGGGHGRNFFRGPQYFNTDFSLRKTIALTERYNLQIGANAFNVLNHANFSTPEGNNLNGNFGFIDMATLPPTTPYGAFAAAAEDMRIVQVMGKFSF
jgi:outer membrane receptor protein involved in Fe transport